MYDIAWNFKQKININIYILCKVKVMYDYNSVEYEIWYDNKNRNLFFSVLYIKLLK